MLRQIIDFFTKSVPNLVLLAFGLFDFICLFRSRKKTAAILILVFILVLISVRFVIYIHPEKAEFTGEYLRYSFTRGRNEFVFDAVDQEPHRVFYSALREAQLLKERLVKGVTYTFTYEKRTKRIYIDTITEAE